MAIVGVRGQAGSSLASVKTAAGGPVGVKLPGSALASKATLAQAETGTDDTKWVSPYVMHRSFYSARAFGVLGDTGEDMSANIETALNSGLRLEFPEGVIICGDVDNLADYHHIIGCGEDVTTFKRKSGATYIFRAASAKTGLHFQGFTLEGIQTDSPINQEGISLVNAVRPTIRDVRGKNLYATFGGGPTGRAVSLSGGNGANIENLSIDTCGDGLLSIGHTDGRISTLEATGCTRSGILLATASHRWRHRGVSCNSNCTTYAGAGFLVIDSDDAVGGAPICHDNTLGHGYQHNNADRGRLFGATTLRNGISGVDWYDSKDGALHDVYSASNTVRGVEIDTDSDRCKVFGGQCLSNGDKDWSVYRSADVELHGVVGNITIWDGTTTAYTKRTSIFGGGFGYTLTATAGQATGVQSSGWRGSYSDPSSVITKTTFA